MTPSSTQSRTHRTFAALLAGLALATLSGIAQAQSVSNGKTLYITPQVSGQLSCSNAQCHTADPTINQNRIKDETASIRR